MSRPYRAAKFAMAASGSASATRDERRLASAASLHALLSTPPRLLSASDLHSCLALLDDAASTCRAELQRRPSHCRALLPKKAAAAAAPKLTLLELPAELLAFALSFLRAPSLAACDRVSRSFHEPQGLVERALRLRALGSGHAPAALPGGFQEDKQALLLREWANGVQPTVAAGNFHSLFISADGALLAAGGGDHFDVPEALGLGADVEVVDVPTRLACPRRYSSVAASQSHSLATSSDGQVFSWGDGRAAGHAEDTAVPTLLPALSQIYVCCVSAGAHHSLAVTDEGAIYSWGHGTLALGHGNAEACPEPKRVEALRDQRVCMVAAGDYHSLAVSCAGGLYSWGDGGSGQLGHDDENNQPLPKRIEAEGLQEGVRSVAAGALNFSLAVTGSGALYTWGANGYGQLGHGDDLRTVAEFVANSRRKQPVRVAALQQERVRCVAAGHAHTLAVTDSGELYTWGLNDCGQLGRAPEDEDNPEDLVPTLVEGLDPICAVAAGAGHSIVVTCDGRAFGFGEGEDASLGLSLTENQYTPLEYPELRIAVLTESLT